MNKMEAMSYVTNSATVLLFHFVRKSFNLLSFEE